MTYSLTLLKQLFFVIVGIFAEIIKNIWRPLYTTTIKLMLIAGVIWTICHVLPHHLPYLHDVSFIGWATLILVYRLLTIKYDDFDDTEDETPALAQTPNYLEDEEAPTEDIPENIPPPAPNSLRAARMTNDLRDTSTRE